MIISFFVCHWMFLCLDALCLCRSAKLFGRGRQHFFRMIVEFSLVMSVNAECRASRLYLDYTNCFVHMHFDVASAFDYLPTFFVRMHFDMASVCLFAYVCNHLRFDMAIVF